MNNLETTSIFEIIVIGIAVAQALTIVLTIRRERDIKELRELVEEQRLRIIELRAWLDGRSAVQRTGAAPRLPATTPKESPEIPSTTKSDLERTTNVINWLKEDADKTREIVASLHGPRRRR